MADPTKADLEKRIVELELKLRLAQAGRTDALEQLNALMRLITKADKAS